MKKLLLFISIIAAGHELHAQALSTKTGLRFYEHHSAAIAGPMGANGSQSGYDFVNNDYVNSFDSASFGPHTNGTDTTIDMVEHNGLFGNGGQFGFTSGVSSIWNGDIQGNGKTMWMEAPVGFDYSTITDVNQVKNAYNVAMAMQAVSAAKNNTVYIGRIRNSNLYVAMRTYNVTNQVSGNTYFDFDYKYGVWNPATTNVNDLRASDVASVYPNPSTGNVTISNSIQSQLSVKVVSLSGQQVSSFTLSAGASQSIDMSNAAGGMYFVVCTTESGRNFTHKLMKL